MDRLRAGLLGRFNDFAAVEIAFAGRGRTYPKSFERDVSCRPKPRELGECLCPSCNFLCRPRPPRSSGETSALIQNPAWPLTSGAVERQRPFATISGLNRSDTSSLQFEQRWAAVSGCLATIRFEPIERLRTPRKPGKERQRALFGNPPAGVHGNPAP
jgi:hypothetical protein